MIEYHTILDSYWTVYFSICEGTKIITLIIIDIKYLLGHEIAQEKLASNVEDQKKTIEKLADAFDTLKKSLKPMIDQHMEAANMTMTQQAAFVDNLEDHENDLDDLVKTVEKLTQMTNVLFYLVCGLGAVTLMFFAALIYTRCSNNPQFH